MAPTESLVLVVSGLLALFRASCLLTSVLRCPEADLSSVRADCLGLWASNLPIGHP